MNIDGNNNDMQEERGLRIRRSLHEVVHRDQRDMAGKVVFNEWNLKRKKVYICVVCGELESYHQVTRTLDSLFHSGYSKEFRPGVGGPPTQVDA